MRLSTRLRYGLARFLLKAGSGVGPFSIVPNWVTDSVLNPTFRSLTRDGYQKSSAFFACVSALAFAFPEPPLLIYDDEGDQGQSLPRHGLRRLLRRPTPFMGEAEIMVTTMVYMAVGGNAYWHKLRGKGNQVVQLRPYHAGQIIPVPGGENWIQHYLYDNLGTQGIGSTRENLPKIDPADIVHFKWPSPDPAQPWMAQPPILSAAAEVDSDVEAVRYVFALLHNDAIPRTVLTVPGDRVLDDAEVRRMKEQWRERYGGANRGDVAILEGGSKVDRLGMNLQELAFDALVKLPETRIAASLRVPPILAGLNAGLERSTFSNYGEARTALAQDTLIPLWRIVASEVTADLLPEFPGDRGVEARFDTSKVAALQEDTNAKYKRVGDAYQKGVLKLNEARRALGYPDDPEGERYYQGFSLGQQLDKTLTDTQSPKAFVMLGDGTWISLPYGAAQVVTPGAKLLDHPHHDHDHDHGVESKDLGELNGVEKQVERAVVKYLRAQYRKAAEGVRSRGKSTPDTPAIKADPLDPDVVDQLGLDLGPGVAKLLRRYYVSSVKQGFTDAADMVSIDLAFDVENRQVQKVLGDLAKLVTRVTETTRNDIRALIGKQAAEGWSIEQLAEAIIAAGVTTSESRATMIARTETALAYSKGSILGYELSGVVESIEWLATLDKKTCPDCRALNGTTTKLGSTFSDGTESPPRHPNCRCTVLPVLKK